MPAKAFGWSASVPARPRPAAWRNGSPPDARLAKISVKEARQRSVARIPIGRMASPREIADAVLFLTSPRAGYVTGVTLSVDGGQNPSVV